MPTLDWIGKNKVINHHLDVPFRVLEKKYTYSADNNATESENKIIHGDNLEALKSLLPEYEGKIDCIYIDPPYNTGNEGWIYNDNVNDPRIKKWLGEVVGRESEDFTRHDKWLCMMYPRLKLLQKLLSEKGAIFISIDDNEQANLKLICDEIFGSGNFVANAIWRNCDNSNNDAKQFSNDHNSTLIYSKEPLWQPNKIMDDDKHSHFKNPTNDPKGPYFDGNPLNSPNPRENLKYTITSPNGNIIQPPPNGWRWSKETLQEKIESGEIFFTEDGKGIRRRTYLCDLKGLPPSTLWIDLEKTGSTRKAKYDLKKIFPEYQSSELFSTPKPAQLIEYIIQLATNKDSIILDSFAGSGTTAHAVLSMNRKDNGNRSFILIEMMDYAGSITAERVKRVIKGYADNAGTQGTFSYYELGEPLLINNLLNEKIPIQTLRDFIWYTETNSKINNSDLGENQYFLGKHFGAAYWFYYEKDKATTLDIDFLNTIKNKYEQYIIYADICLLPKELLVRNNIIFKKIPRDIKKF